MPAGIAEAQLSIIVSALRDKGVSLRTACSRGGVAPRALRRLRFDDPRVARRIDEARCDGLHARASRCEHVAHNQASGEVAARLRARALKYRERAASISRGRFWFKD
jgi:hypothetical protein